MSTPASKGSVKGEEAHAEVVRLYERGWTLGSIARSLGVFTTQVTQVLERAGLRKPKKMVKLAPEVEQQIASLYASGSKPAEIAASCGVSTWRVYQAVRELGVKVKPRGGTMRSFSRDEVERMAELWRSGVAQTDIAKEFGTVQVTVSKLMRQSGLDLTTKWRKRNGHALMKGGRIVVQGYVKVLLDPTDPLISMVDSSGYVPEHRLVMARKLGRALGQRETVHHIDGDRSNNAVNNLQLRQGKHGKHECWACLDCGSRNVGAVPL